MKYLMVTGPVRQKDGSEVVETQIVRVSEAVGAPSPEEMGIDPAAAVEVPRMPREFERWQDGAFVWDAGARERAARRRRWAEMDRADLIDLLDRLEARVAALESKAGIA